MKPHMRRIALCLLLLVCLTPVRARADIGPKPSVRIRFSGMKQQTYYVTLLSARSSTGPAWAYDGTEQSALFHDGDKDFDIWQRFTAYQDSDGYYFLQQFEQCRGDDTYVWGYFPPSPFKVLLYFPEQDTFAVSEICERYAFDSYYAVRWSGAADGALAVERQYPFQRELLALAARIVLTIAIELLVALPFGFRARRQLRFLAAVNLVTQVALNLLLHYLDYSRGPYAFVFYYAVFELLVLAAEAMLYRRRLPGANAPSAHPVCYACAANALSFVSGLWLANVLPDIF